VDPLQQKAGPLTLALKLIKDDSFAKEANALKLLASVTEGEMRDNFHGIASIATNNNKPGAHTHTHMCF
jgi:hypothetical protein